MNILLSEALESLVNSLLNEDSIVDEDDVDMLLESLFVSDVIRSLFLSGCALSFSSVRFINVDIDILFLALGPFPLDTFPYSVDASLRKRHFHRTAFQR